MSGNSCELFGLLGITIQIFLGISAFSTLVYKRFKERKPRPWIIWSMDTSKQAIGACYLHFVNLFFAEFFGNKPGSDKCKWYFLNYMMDIIFGTFLNYLYLLAIEKFCKRFDRLRFRSGEYGGDTNRPSFFQWFYQFNIWIFILTFAKINVIGMSIIFEGILERIGEILLYPFTFNEDFELMMVMVTLPFFFNAAQFWIQDNFLKKREIPKKKEVEVTFYDNLLDKMKGKGIQTDEDSEKSQLAII